MRTINLKVMTAVLFLVVVGAVEAPGQKPSYARMSINNMGYWYRADGHSRYSPNGTQHVIYPEGTSTVCASDGVIWGGNAYLDAAFTQPAPGPLFRMGGQFRGSISFQPGPIAGFGATAVPVDPATPDVRIYRIRRGYTQLTEDELRLEAAQVFQTGISQVTNSQMQQVYAQYATDWAEWPVHYGAPFIDRNGNGVYDPPPPFSDTFTMDSLIAQGRDEPGVAGIDPNSPADQVIWTVNNNLSPNSDLFQTLSDGCEAQHTLWGYKRTGPLGQIVFRRVKIINKGGVDIGGGQKGALYLDSMYIALEADPDLGDFTEDIVGVDTTQSLVFIYNAFAKDRQFSAFGIPPPAIGFDFLQGPRVPSPGDSAVFNLKRVYDAKNLPLTSFAYFSSGSAIADPPTGVYEGALRWKKMFRGFVPDPSTAPDRLYPFPPGVTPDKFPLSGDPVAGTGFLDGQGTQYSLAPGDRRIVLSSGPFQLAPGDTQELVVAYVGGLGADRISSVAVMKFNDRFAQNTYDALFQVPNAPAPPNVKVAELDEKVIIEWSSDQGRVKNTEQTIVNPGDFRFEGYNVYQFPSRSSLITEARRIATFDLESDPTVILDERFDQTSGQVLKVPVQFGTNSAVRRVFEFNRDYIRDIEKLYNGQEYYIAVTAYSHSKVPNYIPSTLESDPIIITVRPQVPFGKSAAGAYGDTLSAVHTGSSAGSVIPIVIDPTKTTGHSYRVNFVDNAGSTTWTLTDEATSVVLLSGQENQSGDELYPIVDGIMVKVLGAQLLGQSATVTPSADRWFQGASGSTGELLSGAVALGAVFRDGSSVAPADYKTVELRFVSKTGYVDLNGNSTYDIGEPYTLPATGTQKAFMYTGLTAGTYEGFFDIPFTAWDVQDPLSPRQLNVIVRDRDANMQWDLDRVVSDPALPNNGDQQFNYVWIASTTYDPTGTLYDPGSGGTDWMGLSGTKPSLWGLWLAPRGTREPYQPDVTLKMVPNFVNTPADVFTFAAPEVQAGAAEQRAAAEGAGVYPNPYYAFNPAETSRFQKFVTFVNVTPQATIRVFNLAGEAVRVIRKDDQSAFVNWDLLNDRGIPVGSGMYIAQVEMVVPGDGSVVTKVLKLAVIQEKEILDVY